MSMLSDQELEKVVGGVLTDSAVDWFNSNYEKMVNAGNSRSAIDNAIKSAMNSKKIYDETMLKQFLRDNGIKVDKL